MSWQLESRGAGLLPASCMSPSVRSAFVRSASVRSGLPGRQPARSARTGTARSGSRRGFQDLPAARRLL